MNTDLSGPRRVTNAWERDSAARPLLDCKSSRSIIVTTLMSAFSFAHEALAIERDAGAKDGHHSASS
jgi:hypothetical protein